jgi:hypothetical protein
VSNNNETVCHAPKCSGNLASMKLVRCASSSANVCLTTLQYDIHGCQHPQYLIVCVAVSRGLKIGYAAMVLEKFELTQLVSVS